MSFCAFYFIILSLRTFERGEACLKVKIKYYICGKFCEGFATNQITERETFKHSQSRCKASPSRASGVLFRIFLYLQLCCPQSFNQPNSNSNLLFNLLDFFLMPQIICLRLCFAEKAGASCRFWQMINLRNVPQFLRVFYISL